MTSTSIRAAVCRAFGEPLTIERLQLESPVGNQVQVRVVASAVCHSDIHFFDGAWGGRLPAVWGHEASGVVEALGADVTDLAVGDHVVVTLIRSCGACRNCAAGVTVACTGAGPAAATPLSDAEGKPVGHGLGTAAFAERLVADRSQVVRIDAAIPAGPAALLACGVITGVGAVRNTAQVAAGDSVVVIGTGGVGLNAVQGARLAGADPIIAVDLSDDKLKVAAEFGATHLVNPTAADLGDQIKESTGGAMADHVLITVGAKAAIDGTAELLGPNGSVVIVGMPESGVTTTIDPVTLAAANQRILGSKMGGAVIDRDIPDLVARYLDGSLQLDPLITKTYALDDINEAIEAVKRGEAVRNVIMFETEDSRVGESA